MSLVLILVILQTIAPAASPPSPESDVRRDAAVRAIELTMPSVVNISTETIVEVHDPLENIVREFFGPSWGRRSQQSLGSGVIIDENGYILTNLHVVRRANRITVTLADGRILEAVKLVGTTSTDVALLKIVSNDNEKFSAIRFAPDDDLLLGETVLALGNPFGLGGSVSRGILSSKARRPPIEHASLDVADWLQTDAAINPGNSGGPLVNLRGELIGINVAVYREGQGIGFAIPVKRVSEALGLIFTPERIRQLWFGASIQTEPAKLTVQEVVPGSPADQAGLLINDIILRVNQISPVNLIEFNRELINAGEKNISLLVQRGASRKTLSLQLVPRASVFNAALLRQKLGAHLQALTPELAAALRLSRVQGIVISAIDKNSPAEKAQLRPGDVIQSIDGYPADNLIDAAELFYPKQKGDRVKLEVLIRRSTGNFTRLFSSRTEVVL